MKTLLDRFHCVRLRVDIRARSRVQLPSYKGSTFRGALGMALKGLCCATRKPSCEECLLRLSCLYVYLFETKLSLEDPRDARYRNAPRPLVLRIDRDQPLTLGTGDVWTFGLTVVGRAVKYLPFVVAALQRMGDLGIGKGRGRFDLIRVTTLDGRGLPADVIFDGGTVSLPRMVLNANGSVPTIASGCDTFRLRFITPLRLIFRGELVRVPEFHILASHLARRLEMLERIHCGGEAGLDVEAVIAAAREVMLLENRTRWYDWERYSHRQGRKMRLGGLVGEATYRGDPGRFEPLLTLGVWVHVGKNTSFGLGRYEVESIGSA